MPLTATLKVKESSLTSGEPAEFTLTLATTDGSDVTLTSVSTFTSPVGSAANVGKPAFPPGATMVVAGGGGTLDLSFGGSFYAGLRDRTSTTNLSAIGVRAVVYDAAGGVAESNQVQINVTPLFNPAFAMPKDGGQARFDSNRNSNLLAVI